jgi:hypothetical protein
MMRRVAPLLWLGLLLGPTACFGHVGSPNVVYEGHAGAYPVRVIVKLPGVVPGLADIHVRVLTNGARRVTVLPAYWRTGLKGAPSPDECKPVRGETNLFHSELWLMTQGSYSVHVHVEGERGSGAVIVPVASLATQRLEMPPGLGLLLAALGVLLFAGAITIGAAVHESVLEPGAEPTRRQLRRRRASVAGMTLLLGAGLAGGRAWWNSEDRNHRNNRMHKPTHVEATARVENGLSLLRLNIERGGRGWPPLVPDHGKLMHVFAVREPALDAFAHLHPVKLDSRTFEAVLPPLPAGKYRLYADVTHESGLAQTLTATVELPGAPVETVGSGAGTSSDPDDSWFVGQPKGVGSVIRELEGGYTMVWQNAGPLREKSELTLRFAVRGPDSQPAALEPYMGMFAHAALRRDDGAVFTHLHPVGTISMASQQVLEMRADGNAPKVFTVEAMEKYCRVPPKEQGREALSFPYLFPKSGRYRLWVQVKPEGKVLTGVFDLDVVPAK